MVQSHLDYTLQTIARNTGRPLKAAGRWYTSVSANAGSYLVPVTNPEVVKPREVRQKTGNYGSRESADEDSKGEQEEQSSGLTLGVRLVRYADELERVVAAHYFHYEALEALMVQHEFDFKDKSLDGLRITHRWLRQRDDALLQELNEIRAEVRNFG